MLSEIISYTFADLWH